MFCDKNQSAAITKAADHGGDLSSCSPQALQAAADYASSKGFDAAAAAIISELTSRYGPAYKEAIDLALKLCPYKKVKVVKLPEGKDCNDLGRKETLRRVYQVHYQDYQELLQLKMQL